MVSNIHGLVRSFGVLIDDASQGYPGNFGSITLADIDLSFWSPVAFTGGPYLIGVSDQVDSLTLRNIGAQNYNGTYGPWLWLGPGAHIRSLSVTGETWHDESFNLMASGTGRMVMAGGWVHEMHVGPLQWSKPESSGSASGGTLLSMSSGQIDDLSINGVETNNGAGIVTQTSGTIGSISVNGLRDRVTMSPSITLSNTTTNVLVASAEVGDALLSGSAPATLTGSNNVLVDGTGNYPSGRHIYSAIYHLNENVNVETIANDSSANFAPPLLLGTSTGSNIYRVTGQIFGNCYNFPGNQFLTARSPIKVGQQFWLSYWFEFTSSIYNHVGICSECNHLGLTHGGFQALLVGNSGLTTYTPQASCADHADDGISITSAHACSSGSWHFVVEEIDGVNGVLGISVDGNAMETTAFTGPATIDTTENFALGSTSNDTGSPTIPYAGYLSDLVSHPGLPSSGDISAIWNGGTGLQAPYP